MKDPEFDFNAITADDIIKESDNILKEILLGSETVKHSVILDELLNQIIPIDFEIAAFPQLIDLRSEMMNLENASKISEKDEKNDADNKTKFSRLKKHLEKLKLTTKHYLILSVENVLVISAKNKWGLCKNHDFIYLYNGEFWNVIDKEVFQKFLGMAAEKMGVAVYTARYYQFREQLFKQFLATAYLPSPEILNDSVFINLKNGTFEVTNNSTFLRTFNATDFITYQLPFEYNPSAKAPIFQNYLDKVLPDKSKQLILAEYLGYVFIKHGSNTLKEEKTLLLYGSGANGKSVFFEVVNALLGTENVSSYSLQSLTNDNGYFRAKLANKLVNYASEINGKLETAIFKQMVSGEPVEARLPYCEPFTLTQYAKLIFNCNELPRDVEHTRAYFRRFLIIPFDVTIPEEEQDKSLHIKIIESELSGVFNWVLEGLKRLLDQKHFTYCQAVQLAREQYERQSDSVNLFLEENEYTKSATDYVLIKMLYLEYRSFCSEDGFIPLNKMNFRRRLDNAGILTAKNMHGNIAYITKPL